MPAGLVDILTETERLDLFRFLAELGKPGPFDASMRRMPLSIVNGKPSLGSAKPASPKSPL